MGKKHCRVRERQEKSDNNFFPFLDDKSENALKHFFPAQSLKKQRYLWGLATISINFFLPLKFLFRIEKAYKKAREDNTLSQPSNVFCGNKLFLGKKGLAFRWPF